VLSYDSDLGLCRAILRDPSVYPEPDAFKPERFINQDGSLRDDPLLSSAFGYGKRICPGRHFVDATLFIYAASLLSIFLIKKVHGDQEGQSEYKYTGSMLRKVPFLARNLNRGKKTDCSIYF
jgi:cytochrome P450